MALNIPFLAPAAQFSDAAERLRAQIAASQPITGFGEVLLPGDPELRARRHRLEEGIPIPQPTWDALAALAAEWNVSI
jgi:LDH2 family malate/lactate/ureidoglycolate dehydrogenase